MRLIQPVQNPTNLSSSEKPVSLDAATANLNSLSRAPGDGRPQLVDLGMPVFTDPAPPPPREPGKQGARA